MLPPLLNSYVALLKDSSLCALIATNELMLTAKAMSSEYFLPLLSQFGFKDYLKHSPEVPDSDVTVEYCARRNWLVGSPKTVAEKIERVYHEVGGFGVLLVFCFDYKDQPEAWRNSMRLGTRRSKVRARLPYPADGRGAAGRPCRGWRSPRRRPRAAAASPAGRPGRRRG